MKGNMHTMLHWMHDEAAAAGHWCSVHMVHDHHFWLYLLIALAAIAFITLLFALGSNMPIHPEFQYYPYPYGTV